MKAKVKLTGEIVNVEPDGSMKLDCPAYITDSGRRFDVFSLEFEKEVDWEQVRIQAAIAAMQGLCSNSAIMQKLDYYDRAELAVGQADALIEELKKKRQ